MPRLYRWLLPLLLLLLVTLALLPALRAGPLLSSRYDWRYFESMSEVARRTVVWYRQVPLWNPYSCGGEVDLANPQSLDGAPSFLLVLLFGTAWGFKLSLGLYYFLALGGMYQLGRRLTLARAPAMVSAAAFGLSGYLAMHLSAGHINFAGVALFPYLVYCFDRALLESAAWILPAGALSAWVAVFGGTFTPALGGELLCLWVPLAVFRNPDPKRSLPSSIVKQLLYAYGLLGICGGVALLVGAYRMLPTLEFIFDHPRPLFRRTPDMTPIWRLFGDLFAWRDLTPLAGRRYWAHEYTARLPLLIAPLVLLAGAAGVLGHRWRRLLGGLFVLSFIGALLCLGNFSPLAPWSLLQKLPVLRDLRVPSRHLVLPAFFLALLAGVGAQVVKDWLSQERPQLAKGVAALLAVGVALDGAAYTYAQFRDVFTVQLKVPESPPPFFHVEGHWSVMRELLFEGHGVLHCDEEAPLQRAKVIEAGPPGTVATAPARLVDEAAGQVVDYRFTPNVRTITVELLRSDTLLLLNSNWNEHFHVRSLDGGAVTIAKPDGRLAVDLHGLQPGRHVLEVRYAPRSFAVGFFLSLLFCPLFLGLFFFWPRLSRSSSRGETR